MMRLDAMLRVDATCDRLSVALDGGGLTSVTLTPGLYSPVDLAAHIEARLQAVDDSDWTCTLSAAGVVTLGATGHTLSVTWTRPALRDYLGWAANISGATDSAEAPSTCAGVFVPSLPWNDVAPVGWRLELSRADTHRGLGRSFRRAQIRTWQVLARARASELAQLRGVLERMARGAPGVWWRDVNVSSAWGWTSPAGKVDVCLEQLDYPDQWLAAGGARVVVEIPLRFVEHV